MLLTIANILYPLLATLAILMVAHKKREAFIIFLVVEVLMFYIGYESKQWGISAMAVIYFFSNIYAYILWRK